jgi:hypothetical protein
VCVCFGYRLLFTVSVPKWLGSLQGWGRGRERGTQQDNSCTKHAVTNRLPVTATLGRVKEAPTLEFVNEVLGKTFLQNENKTVSYCE